MRLSASVVATKEALTRQYIMEWATNRGLGQQLEHQLQKLGIVLPADRGGNESSILNSARAVPLAACSSGISKSTVVTAGVSKYAKPKSSISSNESLERY